MNSKKSMEIPYLISVPICKRDNRVALPVAFIRIIYFIAFQLFRYSYLARHTILNLETG